MKKSLFLLAMCAMGLASLHAEVSECKLYSTNFQDWDAVSSSTSESTKSVTTRYSEESLTFSFSETAIVPDGTNSKFTADVITTGYAMSAKTATPYIETTALADVTKVTYVHCATGGSRGWGLQCKGDGDEDWVTVWSTYCAQAGTAVSVDINRQNVQLRWYNLNSGQNAYMTELAIYGNADNSGAAAEFTISYFDQNGVRLGDTIQTEDETLDFRFTEADLTIPEGFRFRGWYDSGKKRHEAGEALNGDLRLAALVTPIEVAETGKYYEFDLTKNTFYDDDHECFIQEGGAYYNNHGWKFSAGGKIMLPVADKAYVNVMLCQYSGSDDVVVTTKSGVSVTSFSAKAETDNTIHSFYYSGGADTLVLTFGGQAYIHGVVVYNVQNEVVKSESGYYIIDGGDAAALLMTISQLEDGDKIFLKNGIYDFGEKVLTQISKSNISIIGQSRDGVVILNAPDAATESINNTATLYLTGQNIYLQDLTIQNALDYYKANNGRAVALWAKNSKTICKNVRLLSYQDTYYSNKVGGLHYWEDSEIHGTVDFICGDGTVFFENVLLYAEKRSSNGGGSDALTASNADASDKGYIFHNCTIQSECPVVSLGRMWNNDPQCVFINTMLDYSAGDFALTDGKANGIQRWTLQLMSDNAWPGKSGHVGEYNTMDANGVVTPESNNVTFYRGDATQEYETILTADEAAQYDYANVYGDAWDPAAEAEQVQLFYTIEAGEVTWQQTTATVFLIESASDVEIVTELPAAISDGVTVRAANARGGFGAPAVENSDDVAVEIMSGSNAVIVEKVIENGQIYILKNGVKYNMLGMVE